MMWPRTLEKRIWPGLQKHLRSLTAPLAGRSRRPSPLLAGRSRSARGHATYGSLSNRAGCPSGQFVNAAGRVTYGGRALENRSVPEVGKGLDDSRDGLP